MIPLLLLLSGVAFAAPNVQVLGTCPGPVTVQISDAAPGDTLMVITADSRGGGVIPRGVCAGVPTGLDNSGLVLRAVLTANGDGQAVLQPALPAGACELSLAVLNRNTCEVSQVDDLGVAVSSLPSLAEVTLAPSWMLEVQDRSLCNANDLGLVGVDVEVEPLFRPSSSGANGGRLHTYCRIEARDVSLAQTLSLPFATQELSSMTSQAAPPSGLFDAVTATFDLRAGTPDAVPAPGQVPVTVSIVDASPTFASHASAITQRGELAHGQVVASIVHRLTCPNVSAGAAGALCPVAVRTQLALPLVLSDVTPGVIVGTSQDGGHTGTMGHLAEAIVSAVDAVSGRHVINLSVGWHPVFGGALPGDPEVNGRGRYVDSGADPVVTGRDASWPVGVLAVFDALHYARCHGVLVVTSAGNTTSGPRGNEGMLLPAAWSALPPSAIPSCNELETGLGSVGGPPASLIHPVGLAGHEIDGVDVGASVGREGGTPFLSAFGSGSLDPEAEFTVPGGLLSVRGHQAAAVEAGVWPGTGTSFAAPVVSATAALIWTTHPVLTPEEVIDVIHDKGTPNGELTPAWVNTGWTPTLHDGFSREVRACQVAQDAGVAGIACLDPGIPVVPAYTTTDVIAHGAPRTLSECTGSDISVYDRRMVGGLLIGTDSPCPARQLYDALFYGGVHPQGPKDACPVCSIRPTSQQLYVDVAVYADMTDLTVVATIEGVESYYAISDQPSAAARVIEIPDLDMLLLVDMPKLTGMHVPSGTAWTDQFLNVE